MTPEQVQKAVPLTLYWAMSVFVQKMQAFVGSRSTPSLWSEMQAYAHGLRQAMAPVYAQAAVIEGDFAVAESLPDIKLVLISVEPPRVEIEWDWS